MIFLKSKSFKILSIIIVSLIIIGLSFYPNWRNNTMIKKCPKIVIGKIVGTSNVFDSGDIIYIIDYWYLNKVYRTSAMNINSSKIGDLYFVKISCLDPERTDVLNVRVPNTIKTFPSEGWDKLPPELEKLNHRHPIFFLNW